jgi:hypothetical protein
MIVGSVACLGWTALVILHWATSVVGRLSRRSFSAQFVQNWLCLMVGFIGGRLITGAHPTLPMVDVLGPVIESGRERTHSRVEIEPQRTHSNQTLSCRYLPSFGVLASGRPRPLRWPPHWFPCPLFRSDPRQLYKRSAGAGSTGAPPTSLRSSGSTWSSRDRAGTEGSLCCRVLVTTWSQSSLEGPS